MRRAGSARWTRRAAVLPSLGALTVVACVGAHAANEHASSSEHAAARASDQGSSRAERAERADVSVAPTPLEGGGNRVIVGETSPMELFVEEDRELRARVAAWLASHTPWPIVPPAELETARVRAIEGRDLTTGVPCGAPIDARDAYERAFGTSDTATVGVECEHGCELAVTVRRHPPGVTRDHDEFYARTVAFAFRAPLPHGFGKEALLDAVERLVRTPENTRDGIVGGLTAGGRRPIRHAPSVKVSLWPATDPSSPTLDDALLTVLQSRFDRCYAPHENQQMFLLAVDATGRVGRCEAMPWQARASSTCICDAMAHVAWPAHARRVAFDTVHEPADVEVGGGRLVDAYLRDFYDGPSRAELASCFAQDPPAAPARTPVTFRVGDDARVADLAIAWTTGGFPKDKTRACVEQAFRRILLPCHLRGTRVVTSINVAQR